MFPVVFAPNSQEFNSHGQGVLIDCLSCEVTEERNGIYELTLTYPSSGHHADALVNDAVIKATSHRGDEGQLFRIYEVTTNFDGHIEVQARHISYQLGFIPCAPFSALSVIEAFTKLPHYMLETQGFTFYTANTTQGSFAITKPRSARGVLGGEEGSILDIYHGEYEFDNFTVKLHGARGADRGVTLRYGKNITDINQEQAIDETYTGVWPYWGSQDDVYVELPEHVVYCSNYQDFPYKRVMILDCSNDLKDEYGDDTIPTVEQLRTYAQKYMVDHNFGVPKVSIKVSFESEGITGMDQVMLCDTVSVVFPSLHVSTKSKVVKTVYNTLLGRYNSIEIGEIQSNFASTLAKGMSDSRDITSSEIADTRNFLEKKQAEVTATLLGANGGYRVDKVDANGHIIETLYMNTLDEETATKVWRWNINGLGYSPNGTQGPYTVAITKDGEIVADFITTGTLDAAKINVANLYASAVYVSSEQTLAARLDNLQDQINHNVATWTGPDVPTLNNYPANEWTTAAIRASHVGNVYTVSNPQSEYDGYSYRFNQNGTTFEWTLISDSDVTALRAELNTLDNELHSDYYNKTSIDQQFIVNRDGVLSTVGQTYSTKTQAQGYADTAKSEAISTASSDATTKANNAQSSAISTAAADATTKANTAESNAKGYTDNKLTAYSTTQQMTSAISQSATQIELSVAETYATKYEAQDYADDAEAAANSATDSKLQNYSTTTQMNSAITQKANEITSSVSETYSTKNEAQGYANTAEANANSATDSKLSNYSTTTQINSAINQKANEITSTVSQTYATQATTNSLNTRLSSAESSITQQAGSITSLVTVTNEIKAEPRNLLRNTASFKDWTINGGSRGTVTGSSGMANLGCTYANFPPISPSEVAWTRQLINISNDVRMTYGAIRERTITFSAWAYIPSSSYLTGADKDFIQVELQLVPKGAGSRSWYGSVGRFTKNTNYSPSGSTAMATGWNRIWRTIYVNDDFFMSQGSGGNKSADDSVVVCFWVYTPSQVLITTPQIEYGTTLNAWAPNELDDSLSASETRISQNADAIELRVTKNGVISSINQTSESVKINANRITFEGLVTANQYFKINTDGSIEAKSGKIGGWTIHETYLGKTVTSGGVTYEPYISAPASPNPSSSTAFGIGKTQNNSTTYPFYVRYDGYLYASSANISGTITATSGNIGGCSISDGVLTVKNANIESINGSKVGSGISGSNVTTGTVAEGRIDSKLLRTANLKASIAALDAAQVKYLDVGVGGVGGIRFDRSTLAGKHPSWYTMPAASNLNTVTLIKNALAGKTFLIGS